MVIAVTTWLPLSTPNLPSSSPIPFSLGLRASTTTRRNPGILMAVSVPNSLRHIEEAPEKTNPIYPVRLFEAGFFHFFKYHGLGNDFIMIDNRDSMDLKVLPDEAVKLCERHFGVGADRVVFIMPGTDDTDFSMRILNSDGSEQEMCDNALRCLVKLLADLETRKGFHRYRIQTGAGLRIAEVIFDGKVRVDMGKPVLMASDVPTELPANEDGSVVKAELDVDGVTWNVTCVSMGNPHCVTFGTKGGESLDVDELNLAEIGPKFEHHNVFPARANTVFVQVLSRKHLKVRVWEHGAGATLACGTGACAAVVAAVLEGHVDRKCTVDLPGGPLLIEWVKKDSRLFMIGPAEAVFSASVPLWK